MPVLASVFVALAAILHFAIFWMESFGWRRPTIWKRFNVADQGQADATRDLAFNQGFYNLFLGVGALLGVILLFAGQHTVGYTLAIVSTGSMLAASLVLLTLGRGFARPAATQGVLPLIGLVLTIVAAAMG